MTANINGTAGSNAGNFVTGHDIRMGTSKDSLKGYLTGSKFVTGESAGDKILGFGIRAFKFLKGIVKPAAKLIGHITSPVLGIKNTINYFKGVIGVAKRQDIFPPFGSAEELKQTNPGFLNELAKDSQFCSCTSRGNATPHRSYDRTLRCNQYDLPANSALIGGFRTSNQPALRNDADAIFDRLPTNIKENIDENNGAFIDPETGLVASLILDKSQNPPKIHVTFGGTGAGGNAKEGITSQHIGTDIACGGVVTDVVPSSFRQASALVKLLKEQLGDDYDIECKGFSMGGAIATFAGIDNGVKTVALCPAPMSPRCQKALGDNKMRAAVQNGKMVNLMTEKCWVTGHTTLAKIGRAFEAVSGKRIPHFIGPGYRINQTPPNVQNAINSHGKLARFFDYHNFSSSSWQALAAS
jgi:hypothetical protein